MAKPARQTGFWDGGGARLLALGALIICVAALGYIHRDDLMPKPAVQASKGLNPAFVECRDRRVGQVEKMRQEKTINDRQYDNFKMRAMAFCTAKFPPQGRSKQPGRPPGMPQFPAR